MKKIILPLLVLILINLSCEKESSPAITHVKPGNITGVLDIYESDDNSGAFVSLKGTNISTKTDYYGKWTLTNVEPGVYDIILSKPGYDTTEIYGYQFAGNGTSYLNFQENKWGTDLLFYYLGEWGIYPSSSDSLKIDFAKIDTAFDGYTHSDTAIIINMKTNLSGNNFCFFFKNKPDVSKNNFNTRLITDWFRCVDSLNKNRFILLDKNWDIDKLFKDWGSGTKVYVVIYTFEAIEKDLRNDLIRWLGMSKPSNIAEFIVP